MSKKITWGTIYNDFKALYPNLSKNVVDYRPYVERYMTIVIWFNDGSKMLYNYDTKRATLLSD